MRLITLAISLVGYAVADEEVTNHQNVGKQRTDRHSHTSRRLGKTTGKERLGKTGKEKERDGDEEIMTPYSAGKKEKKNTKHKRNGGGKGNKHLRFGVPPDSKAEKTSDTSEGGESKSDKMTIEGADSKADKMINYSDIMDDKMINYSEMINYSDILVEGGDSKADKMINYSDLVDDADESGKAGKLMEEVGSAKAGKTSDTAAEGKARKLLKLR